MGQPKDDVYNTGEKDTTATGSDIPSGHGGFVADDDISAIDGDNDAGKLIGQDHSLENYEDSEPRDGVGAVQSGTLINENVAHIADDESKMEFKDTESQLAGIREIFDAARTEDKWNLDEEMLYSFYFVDTSIEKLEKLGLKLEADGYEFVDIFELGEDDSDKATGEYLLHIDKVEIHTPESLAQRNVEFQKLADEYEIETFDGWEFGEVGDYDEDEFDDDELKEKE